MQNEKSTLRGLISINWSSLISNLWTNQGLVNGAMGTVVDILYELGRTPPSLPTVILVKMDNYTGPTISISNYHKVIPIRPIK